MLFSIGGNTKESIYLFSRPEYEITSCRRIRDKIWGGPLKSDGVG